MGTRMSIASRRELVAATASRYRASAKREKRRILDEFVAVTGYHRKHAVRILNGSVLAVESASGGGGRPRLYDEAVREALIVLWEASEVVKVSRDAPGGCCNRRHASRRRATAVDRGPELRSEALSRLPGIGAAESIGLPGVRVRLHAGTAVR